MSGNYDPNYQYMSGPTVPPPKKRNWFRRFLSWILILAIAFGGGLAVGFSEDFEAEEFISNATTSFSKPIQRIDYVQWRHIWQNYGHKETRHFHCRMECRRVADSEIETTIRDGSLTDYTITECQEGGYDTKFTVEGISHTGRRLTVVFAANKGARMLKLITVWERGKDFDCPKDC